jgi:hypothetical protein
VDAAERLADYLAGELDADEHAALEAELARDPALRAELDHQRRADRALAALTSPTPPEGFETRLRAALASELAQQLVAATDAVVEDPTPTPSSPAERIAADELVAARARRDARAGGTRSWRWLTAFGGVAASLLLIAVAISVVGPLGGDDAMDATSGDVVQRSNDDAEEDAVDGEALDEGAGPASDTEEAAEEAAEDAADDGAAEHDEAGAMSDVDDGRAGPEVVARGRSLEPGAAVDLLDVPAVRTLVAIGLDAGAGTALADEWAADLGVAMTDDPGGEADVTEEELPAEDGTPLAALLPAERTAVGRCLARVLDTERGDAGAAIPAYVELLTVADEPAVAFVLVTADDDGRFTARQVWIVAQDDCRVLATAGG